MKAKDYRKHVTGGCQSSGTTTANVLQLQRLPGYFLKQITLLLRFDFQNFHTLRNEMHISEEVHLVVYFNSFFYRVVRLTNPTSALNFVAFPPGIKLYKNTLFVGGKTTEGTNVTKFSLVK